MNMKKILVAVTLCMTAMLSAQNPAERYEQRYDMLVSQFGAAGVGVETVLDNWEKVDSTNAKLLLARFNYLFTKAQSVSVVMKDNKKYLGMEPILTFKDSLQRNVYCYQETFFDDELYGKAVKAVDKAISVHPDRLDFRFVKANALIAYEKESPDMAMNYLRSLVAEASRRSADWIYEGSKVGKDFVQEAMQEYCFSFYSIGSLRSRDAFLNLSLLLSEIFPDNLQYVNNIGSYYLVKEDYKTALKHYAKVLKKDPKDYTAIKNSALSARKMKNAKLEMKYLQMLVKYGPEGDALAAKARLEALNK
jgi:tetratricopeptide (TPR) repeat protein